MIETLETLWKGDHIRVNGQDAMYSHHCMGHGWWLEAWLDEKQAVFALPGPPEDEREFLPKTSLDTLELVTKPNLYHTDNPTRGDWFYIWHTLEKPSAYILWSITRPYKDGTYTLQELLPHRVKRYQDKPWLLAKSYGWTNYIKRINGVLHDKDKPIPFFTPPFLPSCLQLPPTQLKFDL